MVESRAFNLESFKNHVMTVAEQTDGINALSFCEILEDIITLLMTFGYVMKFPADDI